MNVHSGWYVERRKFPEPEDDPDTGFIYDGNDFHIATVESRDADAEVNEPGYTGHDMAEYIVAAVNAYNNPTILIEQLREIERLRAALRQVERSCPCGARPESLNTHPHVAECPVGDALRDRHAE